jgi:hypothetical protein
MATDKIAAGRRMTEPRAAEARGSPPPALRHRCNEPENMLRQVETTTVTDDSSADSLLMWMVLPWWTFDSHTVENRHSRIKPPSERRPHHHRNLNLNPRGNRVKCGSHAKP